MHHSLFDYTYTIAFNRERGNSSICIYTNHTELAFFYISTALLHNAHVTRANRRYQMKLRRFIAYEIIICLDYYYLLLACGRISI